MVIGVRSAPGRAIIVAGAFVIGAVAAVSPAVAAPVMAPIAKATAAPTPPTPPSPDGRMGQYPLGSFAADAAKLPAALVAALKRDLGISGEQYEAEAAAAADAARTLTALKHQGVHVRGSRLQGTTLRVYVSSDADAAAASKLGAVADRGSFTVPDYSQRSFVPASSIYDGSGFYWSDGATDTICSVGYTGFKISTGSRQIATAGHCFENIDTISGHIDSLSFTQAGNFDTMSDSGLLGDLHAGSNQFGSGYDSGLIDVTGGSAVQQSSALTWGGGGGAPLASAPTPIYDVTSPVVGMPVCKSGVRTGWSCGSVLDVDQSVTVGSVTVNSIITSECVLPGDSGGAVMAAGWAIGVVSASTSGTSCSGDYFSTAFSLISPGGYQSIEQQNPDWEPSVTVPTPIVTAPATSGVATSFIGGQVNTRSFSLQANLYVDGSTTPITAPAGYGVFDIPLTSVSAGTHSYTLTLSWGTWSVSSPVSGTFRKVDVSRIQGADRFVNADDIAKQAYPSGADTVYVTNGYNYPDALSAGPVAVRSHAPILLTTPTSLPSDVSSTIQTLNPTHIVVLGGVNSVSDSVFTALQALVSDPSNVTRIGGADRFDASRNLAETFGTASTIFISNGFNFPDALSAGPAASTVGAPVLLVNGPASSLPTATLQLFTDLGVTHVVITGGPNSVSPAIESQLDGIFGAGNVTRLGGADRYEASKNINAAYFASASGAFIATGENFPDALAGGAYAGALGEPLYTVHHDCIPNSTSASMASIGVDQVTLLGGINTLTSAVSELAHC